MMAPGMTKRIVGRNSIPGADTSYTMEVHRQEVNCCNKGDAGKKVKSVLRRTRESCAGLGSITGCIGSDMVAIFDSETTL